MNKADFLLDPSMVYLNHGGFGACAQPVFEYYQSLQRQIEFFPYEILLYEFKDRMQAARQSLADFIKVKADEVVWVDNATMGVNVIANSLALGKGDEVLATNHEYGACQFTWEHHASKKGFVYRQQQISLPITTQEDIVEALWQGVNEKTKVIYLSHISSDTAIIFPLKAICKRAKSEGILTVIDGAHALGQIDIDLKDIDCDFYTGNAHKWLLAPKGSGFLYVRESLQHKIEPLVVSWGYKDHPFWVSGNQFIDLFEWRGTQYPTAFLAIEKAIEFQKAHNWSKVQEKSHQLVTDWLNGINEFFAIQNIYLDNTQFYRQMAVAEVPKDIDAALISQKLYDEFRIILPSTHWADRQFLRVSVQAYNTQDEIDQCIKAIHSIVKK